MALVKKPQSITSQILLAVLLPAVVITATLTLYFSWNRHQDIERAERIFGELTTSSLAHTAELGVYAGDLAYLSRVAQTTLDNPSVQDICFLDADAAVLLHQGSDDNEACTATLDARYLTNRDIPGAIQYARPIRSEVVLVSAPEHGEAPGEGKPIGWVVLSVSHEVAREQIREMIAAAVLVALAGLLAGIMFALKAGTAIGGPVRALTQHIKQLRRPNPQIEFTPQGTEETIILAQGINRLAADIDRQMLSQQQQIDSATAKLVARNQQLEDTRKVLEKALHAKDEFLARMSHELRTPLTTVIGFNHLVAKTTNGDMLTEYSQHIEHASQLLRSIIDDILDYSKLESGNVQLESIGFNLQDCLEDVVGLHGYEAIDKQVELVLLIDRDVPGRVIGDPNRLQQVINNLLGNAFKFTHQGSVIVQLALQEQTGSSARIYCEVRDSGTGIAHDEQAHLFRPFVQADSSITRKYGGTGLGLSICASLVNLMGGEISLSSTIGEGTCVRFSFCVDIDQAGDAQGTLAGKLPVLAYDGHEWSRRALRIALLDWSRDVTLESNRDKFIARVDAAQPSLLVLSLSHLEAQSSGLAGFLGTIRRAYRGPILLLSSLPELEQMVSAWGIELADLAFALKPLHRARLHRQCTRLTAGHIHHSDTEAGPTLPLAGLDILVAEDQKPIRELLVRILQHQGARVSEVADGEEALKACGSTDFQLLLLDLHMPRLDGLNAIRQLRATGQTVPIICLTADITAAQQQQLAQAGADAILLKPIDEAQLVSRVCQLCGLVDSRSTKAGNRLAGPQRSVQLQQQLLQLLQGARSTLARRDHAGFAQTMHDMIGLAGLYQTQMLLELLKEIKEHGWELNAAEVQDLFSETELLIKNVE